MGPQALEVLKELFSDFQETKFYITKKEHLDGPQSYQTMKI